MEHVTPETIAYAAVQARFAISSQETWATEDGDFNYRQFWQAIVELFDDRDDERSVSTLAWWNR